MQDVLWVVASASAALCYGSLYEWLVHRFFYHPPTVPAMSIPHARHHDELYPFKRYFERGLWYRAVQPPWLEAAYVVAHGPIFWWIGRHHLGAGIAALVTLTLYALASHYVHPMIHMRTGAWWEGTRAFKFLLKRHVWHHRFIDTNYNVVLPLGDWLFRTRHEPRAEEIRRKHGGEGHDELPEFTADPR
jgi:hypothetical protein